MLGSGNLALILDPSAIATRAGIGLRADEAENCGLCRRCSPATAQAAKYLLVDIAGRRAAVSLGDVLRIEQIVASRIEYIGARPVLNFDGQILPVEDSAGLLAAADASSDRGRRLSRW